MDGLPDTLFPGSSTTVGDGVPKDPAWPDRIGRYEICGLAGTGAMGEVYIAHDPVVDRKVAVKICKLDASHGDSGMRLTKQMFINEVRAAGSLDHPNILRIFDAGEIGDQPYLVMEYIEGGASLEPYGKAGNLLPVETVINYVCQCAEALDYAHLRGITHRDVKPANIMLTMAGEVKIVDFGIAERLNTDSTQVLGAMGSPRYMSPEQAREDNVTGQSDLYSLGVVLYELLTGVPVFPASTLSGLIQMILNETPPSLLEKRSNLPRALDTVVGRALSKVPRGRYRTGAAMAQALRSALVPPEEVRMPTTDDDKSAAARGLRFFEEFTDAQILDCVKAGKWQSNPGGESIVQEGDTDQSFFVIVSGEAAVVKSGIPIARLSAGECFGEIAYLSGSIRTASVESCGPMLFMKFDRPVSEWASMSCQMRFQKAFQRILIERLTQADENLARGSQG